MFNKNNLKRIISFSLVALVVLGSAAFAKEKIFEKSLTATLGRINFEVNGENVTDEIEAKYDSPALVVHEYGDRAYLPLRAIGEYMDLEISYDDKTHTAKIENLTQKAVIDLKEKLTEKDTEIADLQKKIKELEEKKDEGKITKDTLKDLETKLNKDYGLVDDVYFDIKLKESNIKDKISVDLTIDTRDSDQRRAWLRMSPRNVRDMLENLTTDIQNQFKDADIYGSIYNEFNRIELYKFDKKYNSRLVVSDYEDSRYDELVKDAEYFLGLNFKDAKEISIRERSANEIVGKVVLPTSTNLSYTEIDIKFYNAETALQNRYGDGVFFDIELFIGERRHGVYYNSKFPY